MSNISDYQMEQILFKLKANKNSKELSGRKLDVLEKDPKVRALDEYIARLQRGEIMVDIPQDDFENFDSTEVELPELGRVTVYEPSKVSNKRKQEAYETEIQEENGTDLEEKQEKKSNLAKYSVILLKDNDGKNFDLVIDENGSDVGKIIYDEKGKPSFEISSELKDKIDENLIKANVRSYVDEMTIEAEFYLKDIDSLVEAIENGKVVPESVKEAGQRAISAKNIKENNYTEIDASNAIIKTPDEIEKKKEIEEDARTRLEIDSKNNRLTDPEPERDITTEEEPAEDVQEERTRAIQTQPKLVKNEPEKEDVEDKEEENNSIPKEKQEEIEVLCKSKDINYSSIKAVLIIKDPSTLADATENSHINRKGNEVTVLQFSGTAGKDRYIMIQDEVELGGEAHDESFMHLIEPLHRTTGEVKRVEDEKSYLDYTDSSGELKSMQLKRIPQDMSLQEKEVFKDKIEKDIEALSMVKINDPQNTELIDKLEIVVYQDFIDAGLVPPEEIKADAEETKEKPEKDDEQETRYDDDEIDEMYRRRRLR